MLIGRLRLSVSARRSQQVDAPYRNACSVFVVRCHVYGCFNHSYWRLPGLETRPEEFAECTVSRFF